MTKVADFAAHYRAQGWAPLPIPARQKAPGFDGWQNFIATDDTNFNGNIGVILGDRSAGLVDIDLDCQEAVKLAPHLLPQTDAIFGRPGKPRSHWLYNCDPPPATTQFQFDKSMLVEFRSTGGQTVFPPSIHRDTGELITWECDGDPAVIESDNLLRIVGDLAGLSLIARHWPEPNGRYNVEGALIGALLRAKREPDDIIRMVNALRECFGEARQHPPEKAVPRLAAKLADGKPVPGLRRLGELIGNDISEKVSEWMHLKSAAATQYAEQNGGIVRFGIDKKDNPTTTYLCNFTAAIDEVIIRDDGSGELARSFLVKGSPGRIEVPSGEFDSMSWVTTHWGPRASVYPGNLMKPFAADAIKSFSDEAAERTLYTHLGWRKINDRWLYLHAGGAIGSDGPMPGVAVEAQGELAGYLLPPVRDLKAAITAALKLFDLNPKIAAAVWRAPLTEFLPVAFSGFIAGSTGTFKSALTGVAMAHWGTRWDGIHFPANWTGTANFVEKISFLAKDALLVVDDFAPPTSVRARHELAEKAERLLRGAGNLSGRGRMTADTSLRQTYHPRGLVFSSGEDVPGGQSLRARMLIEQVGPGDIDVAKLTELQTAARHGLLAEAMAGFVIWLAAHADNDEAAWRTKLHDRQVELRDQTQADHRRTPDIIASLLIGVELFLNFAVQSEAIEQSEFRPRLAKIKASLARSAASQDDEQREADPVVMFLDAIPAALAAGKAHVAARSGEVPMVGDPAPLGWRQRTSMLVEDQTKGDFNFTEVGSTHMPLGNLIGWIEDDELWLIPDPTISAVNALLRDQGQSIAISKPTLGKRLKEAGKLRKLSDKGEPTVPTYNGGVTQRVYVMSPKTVFGTSPSPTTAKPADDDEIPF